MEEIVTALLRIAARSAGASAALVARHGDDEPVAAWGCNEAAARALLRVRRSQGSAPTSLFAATALTLGDGSPGEAILVDPPADFDREAFAVLAERAGAECGAGAVPAESDAIARLSESIEQLGDAIAILATERDRASHLLHVNAAFTALFGFTVEDVAGVSINLLVGPLTNADRLEWMRARVLERKPARAVVVLYTRERTPVWTEIASAPVQGRSDAVHHVVTLRDVTARKQFEESLAAEKLKLQTTLAAIADAVVTVLPDGRVQFINGAAQQLLGVELIDAYGADVRDVLRLVDDDGVPIDTAACDPEAAAVRRGEAHLHVRAGIIDVSYVASRIDGENAGTVIVLRDVTSENRLAMRLSFEASHDPLTGLQNRRAFAERLDEAVRGAREQGEHHCVGFLDLDRFKIVNDRFGHATGDRLLREIGRVMGHVVRGGDMVARIGGDEFGLLLANCRLDDARRVAEKVRAAVDAYRIEHEGEVLDIGVSVGLAPIEADTASAATALAAADAACYQAKAAGRNAIAG